MSANFPASKWDGSSPTRQAVGSQTAVEIYAGPDAGDWQQLLAEVQSIEFQLGAGGITGTTATAGFIYVPKVAGPPTGVPANVPAGFLAACYDTTNNKIWVYNGSAWKYAAMT